MKMMERRKSEKGEDISFDDEGRIAADDKTLVNDDSPSKKNLSRQCHLVQVQQQQLSTHLKLILTCTQSIAFYITLIIKEVPLPFY